MNAYTCMCPFHPVGPWQDACSIYCNAGKTSTKRCMLDLLSDAFPVVTSFHNVLLIMQQSVGQLLHVSFDRLFSQHVSPYFYCEYVL